MPRNPIYTTFQPGELERQLKILALKTGPVNDAPEGWTTRRRHRFHLRNYDCLVTFPDGTKGNCHYTRQGPRWHIFRYGWGEPNAYGLRDDLPLVYHADELRRDAASIEAMAQEKAASAFRNAIWQERKTAMRAQPPWTGYGKRKADPALYTLSRERATALAGRYALCARLEPSGKLLAISATFEALEEVNSAWRETRKPELMVAICCRWARRWMPLRFNTT